MRNRDKRNEFGELYNQFDCPWFEPRNLAENESCWPGSRACKKGFDAGQLERGDLISDIICWLDEECEEENDKTGN